MVGRDHDEPHRAATPLELLFDLTFVVSFLIAGCSWLPDAVVQAAAGATDLTFAPVLDAAVCEIGTNPERFDGRLIRVRARLLVGFEISAPIDPDEQCRDVQIWFSDSGSSPAAYLTCRHQSI